MEIRLTGTQADIQSAIVKLKTCFEVYSVSHFYPNRGADEQGRVYVKVKK